MGNTLEDYRCRIGTFMHRTPGKANSVKISQNHFTKSFKLLPGNILILLLVLTFRNPGQNTPEPGAKTQVTAPARGLTSPPPSVSFRLTSGNPNINKTEVCFYVNHNFWARYLKGNIRRNGIKLAHWNQGPGFLSTKRSEIEHIINGYQPHILGISEGTFHLNHNISDVKIDNYDVHFSKSLECPQQNCSRLAVYIHKDLKTKVREDLMDNTFNSIWIECGLPRQKKILVCNVYRQWQLLNQGNDKTSATISSQLERFSTFLNQWERAIATGKEICVLGDFNLNFLNFGQNDLPVTSQCARLQPLVQELFDRIVPHGFAQMVSGFTRSWPNQDPSCLDHLWTNIPEKFSQVQSSWAGGSDHKMIFAIRYTKAIISKPRLVRKRSYKNFNPQKFLEAVHKISWWPVYAECFDTERAAILFTSKLNEILDIMAPLRTFQIRTKYTPWMSQSTKDLIQERNEAQARASNTNNDEEWRKYKRLRNRITNILREEKSQWQKNKLEQLGNNSSSIWKNVKHWLGWTTGGPPTQLISEGNMFSKPKDLARIMNNFFVNKVKVLRQNLPNDAGDPLALTRRLMSERQCSFKFTSVHPDEVNKIIENLKNSKSSGIDNIDTYIIKLARKELVPVITHIINLSLTQSHFPEIWKTAKTIPLHKRNEKIYPQNFRPVSLLPICSKILERVVFLQIISYMESNRLLHPFHHGFRAMHNTTTALLQMMDVWLEALDEDNITAVIMLDLSAAFDVVDYFLLLEKLKIYGFDEREVVWMYSYLAGRRQQVYVDGCLSEPADLEAGVPQGSILGPLLYIIFTNDLPEIIHDHLFDNNTFFNLDCKTCGSICSFADDSSLSVSGRDAGLINEEISVKFSMVKKYMSQNKLVLNSEKTHLLVMATRNQHRRYGNFGIVLDTGNEVIDPIDDEKLLGCRISNDFKFNKHIRDHEKSMSSVLFSKLNALKKISISASFKNRKMIAEGIIMSNILYVITVYGASDEYLLNHLQVIQNNAARCVTRLGWNARVTELLSQCGWMSVRQLVYYHTLIQVFKIRRDGKPTYLYRKLSAQFDPRTRLAVGNGIRGTLKIKSEERRKSFIPRAIRTWNSLPVSLRKIDKINEFKKQLNMYVKKNVKVI